MTTRGEEAGGENREENDEPNRKINTDLWQTVGMQRRCLTEVEASEDEEWTDANELTLAEEYQECPECELEDFYSPTRHEEKDELEANKVQQVQTEIQERVCEKRDIDESNGNKEEGSKTESLRKSISEREETVDIGVSNVDRLRIGNIFNQRNKYFLEDEKQHKEHMEKEKKKVYKEVQKSGDCGMSEVQETVNHQHRIIWITEKQELDSVHVSSSHYRHQLGKGISTTSFQEIETVVKEEIINVKHSICGDRSKRGKVAEINLNKTDRTAGKGGCAKTELIQITNLDSRNRPADEEGTEKQVRMGKKEPENGEEDDCVISVDEQDKGKLYDRISIPGKEEFGSVEQPLNTVEDHGIGSPENKESKVVLKTELNSVKNDDKKKLANAEQGVDTEEKHEEQKNREKIEAVYKSCGRITLDVEKDNIFKEQVGKEGREIHRTESEMYSRHDSNGLMFGMKTEEHIKSETTEVRGEQKSHQIMEEEDIIKKQKINEVMQVAGVYNEEQQEVDHKGAGQQQEKVEEHEIMGGRQHMGDGMEDEVTNTYNRGIKIEEGVETDGLHGTVHVAEEELREKTQEDRKVTEEQQKFNNIMEENDECALLELMYNPGDVCTGGRSKSKFENSQSTTDGNDDCVNESEMSEGEPKYRCGRDTGQYADMEPEDYLQDTSRSEKEGGDGGRASEGNWRRLKGGDIAEGSETTALQKQHLPPEQTEQIQPVSGSGPSSNEDQIAGDLEQEKSETDHLKVIYVSIVIATIVTVTGALLFHFRKAH